MYALKLLGSPQIITPSGSLKLERRPAAVSAYLALEGSVPKYKLAGMLWPDSGETAARSNMRQLLRRMRIGGADIIEGEDFIQLREGVQSDVGQFSALDLERVLEFHDAGELLEGYDYDDAPDFDEWLISVKEELRELRLRATLGEAKRLENAGEYAKALTLTQTALKLEPLSEESHRQVMRLHYLLGDRAAAFAAFERCKQILANELGAKPLPETLRLAQEIEQGVSLPKPAKPLTSVPLAMLHPPVLVGREREWQRLEDAWAAGQFIAIGSQGGLGKTRLMMDFIHSKVAPESVLYIQARPGDSLIPYSSHARNYEKMIDQFQPDLEPWVRRELSRIIPKLAEGTPPSPLNTQEERLRFYQAKLQATLAAVHKGMRVIASDDVHYTDPHSAEAALYMMGLMGSTSRGPVAVYAYRQDELNPQIAGVIEGGTAAGLIAKIHLEPLGSESIKELLEGLSLGEYAALVPGLLRYTGGNPLFILETVRHLHQTGQLGGGWPGRLPPTGKVKELTERRLEQLSKPALNLAQAAAVLRSDFSFELVCETVGHSPFEMTEAWAELEAAQIMTGERFSHDLLFEAVQTSTPEAVRGWLNRAAARALERRGANPARVARHWLEGGDEASAAPWLLRAAARARDTFDLREAADLYAQAGKIYQAIGDRKAAFDSLLGQVKVLFEGEGGPALDEAVAGLGRLASTSRQKAQAFDAQARQHITKGQKTEGERAARAGLELIRGMGEASLELSLLNHLGTVLWLENRLEEAEDTFRQILELAESLDDSRYIAEASSNLAVVLDHLERHPQALRLHKRAQVIWEDLDSKPDLLTILSNIAVCQSEMGLVREAVESLEWAESLSAELDEKLRVNLYVLGSLGVCWADLCNYGRALDYLGRAHRLAAEQGSWNAGILLKNLAWVYLDLGQLELAEQLLKQALALPNQTPQTLGNMHLTQARLRWLQGHPAAAEAALAEAEGLFAESGRKLALGQLWVWQSLTAAQGGLEHGQRALELAQAHDLGGLQIAAHTRCAQAHLASNQPVEALEHSRAANELLATHDPIHFYKGEVLWTHYQALKANQDPGSQEQLEATLRWLTETAEKRVPAEHRQSFLMNNPVNRAIVQAGEARSQSV